YFFFFLFFFSSRRRHTRFSRDWSSDVCSSDLKARGTYTPSADTRAKLSIRRGVQAVKPRYPILIPSKGRPTKQLTSRTLTRIGEIGRASCRERGESWGGEGVAQKKKGWNGIGR